MQGAPTEVAAKLALLREALGGAGAIRLRGSDWFAWATAGGSNTVLLAAETGVAEILVTRDGAWVLTDPIEAARLQAEELPPDYRVHVSPWMDGDVREQHVAQCSGGKAVLSDRPEGDEQPLPDGLLEKRYEPRAEERDRYLAIGRAAAEAMHEVMHAARPEWTELQLAGEGARALWKRGLHPALTIAAGSRRLPLYRHPTPRNEPLGRVAMLVFCARGYGLVANLTRFVLFGRMSEAERLLHETVRRVEGLALDACKPGAALADVYRTLANAYARYDCGAEIQAHHQGGLTGYLAREVIATPLTFTMLRPGMAIALNPSQPGAKIEDTFLLDESGSLQNATFDPAWPSVVESGRARPLPSERP